MRLVLTMSLAATLSAIATHGSPPARTRTDCSTGNAVWHDSLIATAKRTHPELALPANRDSSVIVGLLFDDKCQLTQHAAGHRITDHMTTDTALTRLFREFKPGSWTTSGFAAVGDNHPGTPWVVWAVMKAKGA